MPFELSINSDVRLLHVRAVGVISSMDIDAYYEQLQKLDGIRECNKGLIDFTMPGSRISGVSVSSIRNMSWQFKKAPLMKKGSQMAFVTPNKLEFGFVRVFMARRGDDITIKPFFKMNKALSWLKISDSEMVS